MRIYQHLVTRIFTLHCIMSIVRRTSSVVGCEILDLLVADSNPEVGAHWLAHGIRAEFIQRPFQPTLSSIQNRYKMTMAEGTSFPQGMWISRSGLRTA